MLTIIIALGLVYALGVALIADSLWNAPQGFEDETGFHHGREPKIDL
jgi:hypothetical protein